MPFIRKDKAGSCPGHIWKHDGDIVEVDDPVIVADLLEIPGFSEVASPKDDADKSDSAASDEEPATPKRGRPRKTAQAQTEINE